MRLAAGEWFAALPDDLAGRIDVIVTNPPYVADDEMADLPAEVREWEPHQALCSGPTGLEDIERIVAEAPRWLAGRERCWSSWRLTRRPGRVPWPCAPGSRPSRCGPT